MTTGAEQLTAAITRIRTSAQRAGGMSVSFEMVCAAAETLLELMDSPARVEWCDYHGRPHEFCQLIDAGSCVPRVRAVGPEVALWT
jgi:hypothetical protein